MSEPNERQIEKLLKSAGAKRREQTGSPEMHPVTREMLQTEVRRQYGADPSRAKHGFAGFLRWLPRVAVFLALGMCAWLLWVRDAGQDPMHLAKNEEAASLSFDDEARLRAAEPASRPEPTETGLVPVDDASFSPRPESSAAASVAPALSAVAPAASPVRSLAEAQEADKSVVGTDYFKSDRQGMYMGTAAVGTGDSVAAGDDGDAALVSLMEGPTTGRRMTARAAVERGVAAPAATAMFQNFTVFTTGNVVHVVDADGSTYSGTIQPAVAVMSGRPDGRSDGAFPVPSGGIAVKDASARSVKEGVSLVNFSLLAAGTNRSLGQAVRFEGELALTEQQLLLGRNVFSNTIVPANGAKATLSRANPDQSIPGRLQGTAVLEDGNDVTVDAVPAAP